MPRTKNLYGRTVKPEQAHFVYQSFDGQWVWYILKTYQTPEKEAANEYARWFCAVSSPFLQPHADGTPTLEYGDTYVRDIKAQARLIDCNPLVRTKGETDERGIEPLQKGA
jgi:hypothetical protein